VLGGRRRWLEVDGHPFRVRGAETEAELGLTVRVHGLRELAVFELREVLVREHHPDAIAARLRQRCCHALRHVAEAVALIHETQEWRPVGECERAETLRGLPRTMKEYGTTRSAASSPSICGNETSSQRPRLIRSVRSGAAGWQSMLRSWRLPSSARSLFESGESACTLACSLSVCH
jgi:hypothetical protein